MTKSKTNSCRETKKAQGRGRIIDVSNWGVGVRCAVGPLPRDN